VAELLAKKILEHQKPPVMLSVEVAETNLPLNQRKSREVANRGVLEIVKVLHKKRQEEIVEAELLEINQNIRDLEEEIRICESEKNILVSVLKGFLNHEAVQREEKLKQE